MTDEIESISETEVTLGGKDTSAEIKLAVAALLVGMMHSDDEVNDQEFQAVLTTLELEFSLDSQQAGTLLKLAELEIINTNDYRRFIDSVNQYFTYNEKLKLIELLWRIAYSDKQLHRDEANFARDISAQLAVNQNDSDDCRNHIRDEFI
ncbi:MAG: TerB family tellurite resistance protein [Gammaproteobacteria bacterium]|nr:TerB family tellurite resistance protein [Gammaproteobacteria bacterium]